jgi:exosortase A
MNKPETDLSQFDRQYTFPREDAVGITKSELRRLALPLGGGILLWGLIFHREVVAAVGQWDSSTAYNHCFLVLPIVLYMLWDRKEDLIGVCARPTWKVLPLGIPLAVAWLAAERLGIMEGRQLIAVTFLQVLLLSILGFEFWRRMMGPLLYLYFLVPFGEFLTPRLQDVTTDFVRWGLNVLNIPAYIDGYVIQIPQGTFFIAEACAGLRFLIASIAFGCLYAILMYRSPMRRGVFMAVSIVVPIVANGFRALGIVYLGYLLGSAQAAAADHILYGWIFFSIVILILIALGLPFRQDDQPYRKPGMWEGWLVGRLPFQMPMMAINAVVLAALAAAGPLVAWGLSSAAAAQPALAGTFDFGPGCASVAEPAKDGVSTLRVTCDKTAMDVAWTAFSPRSTAGAVMAQRRRMVIGALTEGLLEHWMPPVDGKPSPWHLMESNDPDFLTAVAVFIEGHPVRPGMQMRLRMAMDSLTGTSHVPVVMTVTPVVNWDSLSPDGRDAAEADMRAFIADHPTLADQVSAMSALK